MNKKKEKSLYLNGLDAATGRPLIGPASYDDITKRIMEVWSPQQRRREKKAYRSGRFAPFEEYKLDDPEKAGWGLLVNADEESAMKDRLGALIAHRNGRILTYQGEEVREWKEKNRADAINPDRFPYYVLIAGSPSKVPFELQFSLDILQAVGRIDFNDSADYEQYAQTVVDQETGKTLVPAKRAVFFAPQHDGVTNQSSIRLVRPILRQLPESAPADLIFNDLIGAKATKANLLTALSADELNQTPAILFSASHGIGVRATDPDHRLLQGSIVCQDYKFPFTSDQRQGFISGYDVAEGFHLPGGIHFFFACYGAGTRAHSDFINYIPDEDERKGLAASQGEEDFVAYLPKALLANPKGGALAVVGHVDPAWVHSFESVVTGERRIHPFGFTLARLMRGNPVGYAVTAFNQKYADLSTDLLSMIEDMQETGQEPDSEEFSDLWICRNDAQNYAIIGDPAVRLKF